MNPLFLLKSACVAMIGLGLVSLAASHPAGAAPWALLFDLAAWPIDFRQGDFSSEARLLNAICGGMLVGWGVTLFGLAAGPIAQGDEAMRRLFLSAVLIWFGLDSLGSVLSGWPGNVLLNAVFLGALAGPLLALKPRTLAAL